MITGSFTESLAAVPPAKRLGFWERQCAAIRATKDAFKAPHRTPDDYRYIEARLKTRAKMDEDREPVIACNADTSTIYEAMRIAGGIEAFCARIKSGKVTVNRILRQRQTVRRDTLRRIVRRAREVIAGAEAAA